MNNHFLKKKITVKFLKGKFYFCFVSKTKINRSAINKTMVIRKGVYWRWVNITKHLVGKNIGAYLSSRKPYNKYFKKKRR